MSREIRKVAVDWKHPKDDQGNYVPCFEYFPYEDEISEGLRDGWLDDEPPNYGCCVMPSWSDSERSHYQMYETTSEGTPIGPVLESPEAVAHWCVDNSASAMGGRTASYEAWLRVARGGSAPTMMSGPESDGELISGVEYEALRIKD